MYQAAHYELVASARAVKIGHEINPDFQIGCMIAMCPIYPATCNPKDILMAMKAMQKRYYFTDVNILNTFSSIGNVKKSQLTLQSKIKRIYLEAR